MSRIHEALRKVVHEEPEPPKSRSARAEALSRLEDASSLKVSSRAAAVAEPVETRETRDLDANGFGQVIQGVREIPFDPPPDSLLINPMRPRGAPSEEFRALRTRLNHLQSLQPLHTLVMTSPSPADGKSFVSTNLAITQAQLAGKRVLLADFDFHHPNIHKLFQIDSAPGITDYLLGAATLEDIMQKVEGLNLYVMTAGEHVSNPLELLNVRECKNLIDQVRDHFDWVILDSPPLLFAADASLLASTCDGTVLVVKIGSTTFDEVTRAIPSLAENNILGVVVNGAHRGELYKYSYEYGYTSDRPAEGASSKDAETSYWL